MSFITQELNHKIEFQRYETTQNDDGDIVTAWATYASAFAKVEPLGPRILQRDYFSAMAEQAEDSIKVTIRY
ncbi:phage head closure protein [Lysobacter sp. A03]|uniref:phage head closure protein n=1 Tax=Lysobacter sp. A03 TaxID=1199154 RepID=UPI0005B6A332|nr:phage head closure protein [Lysobacter sp. A03]KIQ97363.1 hypothetical protein TI01_1080 [Lysobacter sp. A03]